MYREGPMKQLWDTAAFLNKYVAEDLKHWESHPDARVKIQGIIKEVLVRINDFLARIEKGEFTEDMIPEIKEQVIVPANTIRQSVEVIMSFDLQGKK